MANLSKERTARILEHRLNLKQPDFRLEKSGSRIIGNVISPTFKGMRDHQRQRLIWDALLDELGDDATTSVGMLLAFSPEEWNLDSASETSRTRKAS